MKNIVLRQMSKVIKLKRPKNLSEWFVPVLHLSNVEISAKDKTFQ